MSVAMFWTIATVMVVAATAVIVVPMVWLRRAGEPAKLTGGTLAMALAGTIMIPLAALGVYSLIGSPSMLGSQGTAISAANDGAHPGARPLQPGDAATDLGAATARLEAKLAQNPNDAGGWRLLAQSYKFAGRTADAQTASQRAERVESGETVDPPDDTMTAATNAGGATMPPVVRNNTEDLATLRARVENNPKDSTAMVLLAETLRRQREFPEALELFAKLAKTDAMSADLWADYADAHGANSGSLDDQSARFIAEALKLDSRHPKALWLRGSYQTAQKDYRGALATWQRLASILPPESSDAKLITANIAEARAALGEAGAAAPALPLQTVSAALSQMPSSAAKAVAVRGEISLDDRWRKSVSPGSVLFVFAKPAGEAGPPLAVWRTKTDKWPMKFVLDDSSAMLPTRKLSDYRNVVVEARISRSGDAAAQPGDLQAVSAALDPHTTGALQLVISKEIG